MLRPEDRKLFERWTEWNYNRYWSADGDGDGVKVQDEEKRCPISVDIVVIDDPQCECIYSGADIRSDSDSVRTVTALIPIIKKNSPNTKIIFRSHIEGTPAYPVALSSPF